MKIPVKNCIVGMLSNFPIIFTAGIILHGAFFAALIRPLDTVHDKKVRAEKRLQKQLKKTVIKEKPAVPKSNGLISERTGKPSKAILLE